jgi:hypothetical protein
MINLNLNKFLKIKINNINISIKKDNLWICHKIVLELINKIKINLYKIMKKEIKVQDPTQILKQPLEDNKKSINKFKKII